MLPEQNGCLPRRRCEDSLIRKPEQGRTIMSSSGNGTFNAVHVRIGEAKMMADLVHQDMRHEMAKRFIALRPVIEQGAPIEKDHVGTLRYIHDALPVEADALIETHQVEWAFDI